MPSLESTGSPPGGRRVLLEDGVTAQVGGEPLCYLVKSADDPAAEYRVELEPYSGNGWCGCDDFEARRWKAAREGKTPGVHTRCRHIMMALMFLGETVVRRVAKGKNNE
jgi:hypothetical protein